MEAETSNFSAGDNWFTSLISTIYGAAAAPQLWPKALQQLSTSLNCRGVLLFSVDCRRRIEFVSTHDIDSESVREYDHHYIKVCPRIEHAHMYPAQTIRFDYLHTTESQMRRSEFYNWARGHGFKYYIAGTLFASAEHNGFLTLQRTHRQGHVTSNDIERFEQVVQHVRRAVEITQRLGALDLRRAAAETTLDQLPHGVVLLDRNGEVRHLNRVADHILRANDGLQSSGRRLVASRSVDNLILRRAIAGALQTSDGRIRGVRGTITVGRVSGRRPYRVIISPVQLSETDWFGAHPAAIVIISDPEHQPRLSLRVLSELYDLTPAEARLAAEVANGKTIQSYADHAQISIHTARWILRQVLAKTGTRRQAELVSLIYSGPAIFAPLIGGDEPIEDENLHLGVAT